MLSCVLLQNLCSSQTAKDSLNRYKNEIGIDLIPAIRLLSAPTEKQVLEGHLFFKRQLVRHLFIRFNASVNHFKKSDSPSSYSFSNINDTLYAVYYSYYDKSPELKLASGAEYRWGKKRLTYFTGLDIGYFQYKTLHQRYKQDVMPPVIITNSVNDPDISVNEANLKTQRSGNMVLEEKLKTQCIFILPFTGIQFHFSKHFFFSMQMGLQLNYDINQGHATFSDRYNLLNNFALACRF